MSGLDPSWAAGGIDHVGDPEVVSSREGHGVNRCSRLHRLKRTSALAVVLHSTAWRTVLAQCRASRALVATAAVNEPKTLAMMRRVDQAPKPRLIRFRCPLLA